MNGSRLRVETQLKGTRVFRIKTFAHNTRPDSARSPVLCNLFKEIVVGVEEERDTRHKFVNVQPCACAPLHVFNTVAQGESEFLNRRCSGLAYVIAAH